MRSVIEVGDVLVLREAWSCQVNEYELGALGIGDIVCIITVKIGKHGMHSITALSVWYGHAVVLSVSSGNVAMLFGVR
jgi:hypothetical protein